MDFKKATEPLFSLLAEIIQSTVGSISLEDNTVFGKKCYLKNNTVCISK